MQEKYYLVTTYEDKDYVVDSDMIGQYLEEDTFWDCIQDRKLDIHPNDVSDNDAFLAYDGIEAIKIDYAKSILGDCVDDLLDYMIYYWNGRYWEYKIIKDNIISEVKLIEQFEVKEYDGTYTQIAMWEDNYGKKIYTWYQPQYQDSIRERFSEKQYNNLKNMYNL